MMRILLPLLVLTFTSSAAFSYILPTRTILQKTAENAGSGVFAVEQEVQFTSGEETISVKETWLIENDRTMRLTVTGGKDLQSSFRLQFIYNGGQKWSQQDGNRSNKNIPDDFLEKYLNFRSSDIFASTLIRNKIIPTYAMNKKALARTGNEIKYEPESWVRYSRTAGSVNYAMGMATPADQEANFPGLWIEQDEFVVRKLRLPSQVEMTADNYNQFSKGLAYPRARTIRWNNNTVTIRLISAQTRPQVAANLFQPTSLDTNLKWEGINALPAKDVITEFYTRFR